MANELIFAKAKQMADEYLDEEIGISWDELADTNSLHDYINDDMSDDDLMSAVKDACEDRLEDN